MFGKSIFLAAIAVAAAGFPSTCHDGEHHLLPHETDCSKFYYCVFGAKSDVASSCAPGTVFSFKKQECDYPENVKCLFNTVLPSEREHYEFLPNGCPSDIHIHFLLPHEYDCTKFYYCNFGQKVVRDCAPGTAFNFDIQVCDWPENVKCHSDNHEPKPDNSESHENKNESDSWENKHEHQSDENKNESNENKPDFESNENKHEFESHENKPEFGSDENKIEILENGCPADWSIHKLLPHEWDCTKFYYCVYGELVERSCAPGTAFNYAIQVCDWPENVKCANKPGNGHEESKEDGHGNDSKEHGDKDESKENTKESDEDDRKSNEQESNDDGWLNNGCPAEFDIHYLLPDEKECSKFYYCVDGKLIPEWCAGGLVFNPINQVCDWPENYKCGKQESKPEHENHKSEENTGSNENKESHENKDESHENKHESHENHHESNENHDDSHENKNDSQENKVDSIEDNHSCPLDWDPNVLIPNAEDCSKFYYCAYGQLSERECPAGTLFDSQTQVCDWPANVKCASKPGNGHEDSKEDGHGNESKEHDKDESDEDKKESDEEDRKSNEQESNDDGWLANGCPAEFNIQYLLPDEKECSKFYYCVDGQLIPEWCASGLVFNPINQVCDWPDNYKCGEHETKPEHENHKSEENTGSDENEESHENKDDSHENKHDSHENNNGSHENKHDSHENKHDSHENKHESNENKNDSVEDDNSCPLDWDPNVLIPHAEDCSKFYYCVYGQLSERECPGGTLFDSHTQICNWADSVTCFNARCTGCNVAPWPHYTCGKYWKCDGEKVALVSCSEGLHFNGETCDFAENAGCQ